MIGNQIAFDSVWALAQERINVKLNPLGAVNSNPTQLTGSLRGSLRGSLFPGDFPECHLFLKFNFIYFFIQQVLISYLFYTHQCIHVNPNLPIQHPPPPPPLSPLGVHTFVLCICVSISALQTDSSVPFF